MLEFLLVVFGVAAAGLLALFLAAKALVWLVAIPIHAGVFFFKLIFGLVIGIPIAIIGALLLSVVLPLLGVLIPVLFAVLAIPLLLICAVFCVLKFGAVLLF